MNRHDDVSNSIQCRVEMQNHWIAEYRNKMEHLLYSSENPTNVHNKYIEYLKLALPIQSAEFVDTYEPLFLREFDQLLKEISFEAPAESSVPDQLEYEVQINDVEKSDQKSRSGYSDLLNATKYYGDNPINLTSKLEPCPTNSVQLKLLQYASIDHVPIGNIVLQQETERNPRVSVFDKHEETLLRQMKENSANKNITSELLEGIGSQNTALTKVNDYDLSVNHDLPLSNTQKRANSNVYAEAE